MPGERPLVPTGYTDEQSEMTGWARTVANYFTSEKYSFVRVLGEGAEGQAMLVNERDELGRLLRRVAVKTALDPFYDDDLPVEAEAMRRFRGCAHIVQLIALVSIPLDGDSADDPSDDPYQGRGLLGSMLHTKAPRPALVIEYCQNGTLFDLGLRMVFAGAAIPERLLWHILLCRK